MARSSNQDELTEMIARGANLINRPTTAASTMAKAAAPTKR